MADYLFSLGLIPVQEWIAQARRSRDLRAGSVFLWHVMAKLLTRLEAEVEEFEIWTPKAPEGGFARLAKHSFREALAERYGIPNRASGRFTAEDEPAVRRAFAKLEEEMADAWRKFRSLAVKTLF